MGNTKVRRRQSALAAAVATVAMAVGFTALPAEAAPPVDYVALGDSYTAGTGAGAALRPASTPCWQSTPGYVDLVGQTGRVGLVANAACHGAVLSPFSPAYDTRLITPTVHEQLTGLVLSGMLSNETELVSVTAGANDLGFSSVLGACAAGDETICRNAIGQALSPVNLTALTAGLAQTYAAIQDNASNAKIAVMGYPLLFDPASPFAPIPATNQMAMNDATLMVNETLAAAVQWANSEFDVDVQYIDVTSRFARHAANSDDPWLQLDPTQPGADYNFHPNPAGHRAYATALVAEVKPAQLARR